MFVLILVASIISLTHLQHATKPPQLFRPDTNVQTLLDLMANYTSQTIPRLPTDYRPPVLTTTFYTSGSDRLVSAHHSKGLP